LGGAPDPRLLDHAARLAAKDLDPPADHRAPAGYRRDLARAMTRRALAASLARCTAAPQEASAP
ncbi:xanthine dehydrogenase family protein subunit M, partial [Kitasatospora sp. NPDC059571]